MSFVQVGIAMRLLLGLLLFAVPHLSNAADVADKIEGGLSPNRQFQVLNINDSAGGFFVIRNRNGETIFSGKSLRDEFQFAWVAWDACWRPDSRFVAISFHAADICVETVVFEVVGATIRRVPLPWLESDGKIQSRSPYEGLKDNELLMDNTHRRPDRWLRNGDLVINITSGYHHKSDSEDISSYFATIHFTGNPSRASVRSKSRITIRHDP